MRAWCAALALAMSLLGAVVCEAQSVQVTPLTRDGRVLVSWRMTDVFTDDVRAAIHSGMTITFIYDIDLKRAATLWLDRTIASATVTATVKYDNLTRRYQLTRKEDGRIERVDTVEREEAVREWLTEFDRVPLFSSARLERNAEYYLRIRAHTSPRNASFVWPWEGGIAAHVKFTFIQ